MRCFGIALAATLVAVASAASFQNSPMQQQQVQLPVVDDNMLLFVGTYTRDEGWVNGTGKGVHVFQLNTIDGSLTPVGAQAVGNNPTFVSGTHNAKRRVIYATNEVSDPSALRFNTTTGWVYALRVGVDGKLTELNRVESGGGSAAHVSVSPNEKFVTVSNFNGGSVSIFPVNADGSLAAAADFRQYKKVNRDYAHMHSITWVGSGAKRVLGADLGNDRVAQFTVDKTTGKLVENAAQPFVDRPVGSGPRHLAIHPSKRYAYVLGELDNTIGVYSLSKSKGLAAKATQTISTLPTTFTNKSSSADIHASSCGRYLYSSNRGHDSIAMFTIGKHGMLTNIGYEPTRGQKPRSFAIYKDLVVVANQDTNDLQVFRIDFTTGKLVYTNQSASCGTPVSVFIPGY